MKKVTFKLKGRKWLKVTHTPRPRGSKMPKANLTSWTNAWRKREIGDAKAGGTYGFNSAMNGVQTLLMAMAEAGVNLDTEKMRKAVRQAHIELDEYDYER